MILTCEAKYCNGPLETDFDIRLLKKSTESNEKETKKVINYIIGLVHELVRVHYTHAWLQYIYATVFPLLKT